MAVAFDSVGPGATGITSASKPITWTHTPAGTPTVVLAAMNVGMTAAGVAPGTGTATYGGVSMTSLGQAQSNSVWTFGYIELFALANPPSGAQTVSVTPNPNAGTVAGYVGGSLAYTGTGLTSGTAWGTPKLTNQGSAATATATHTGTSSSNMVVCAGGDGSGGETVTAGTQRWKQDYLVGNTSTGCSVGIDKVSASGTVTITWTQTNDFYGAITVELLASSAASPASAARQVQLPPGWFPGAPGIPGTVPFSQPVQGDDDFTPQPPALNYRESAPQFAPGWFPGAPAAPGAVPFVQIPPPTHNVPPTPIQPYITGLSGSTSADWFTDQHGLPRWMFCDSVWPVISSAGRSNSGNWQADMTQVISTRSGQGYTAIQCNLLPNGEYSTYTGHNIAGYFPFGTGTGGTDPSAGLNSSYWAQVDFWVATCASYGITCFLNLLMGEDLASGVAGSWTSAQKTAYGQAVAARYLSTPNIVWMINDDGGVDDTTMTNILTGVRNAGDTRFIACENPQETTSRYGLKLNDVQTWGHSNAQYNWVYTYAPSYGGVEYAYGETSPIPVIRGDGYYFGTIGGPDDKVSREQFWWSVSSASRGYSWGVSDGGWSAFATGWAAGLTSAAEEAGTAGDFQNNVFPAATAFLATLPNWQKLAPDNTNIFITAGRGTRAPYQTEGVQNQYNGSTPDTYVSGSYAPSDGSIALIYFSRGVTTTITIDQTKMAAGYTGTWVDPCNCATTTATTGSTYTKPSSANSAGDHDWLLLLQAPSGGTTANAGLATGTGAALQPVIAITVPAGLATGTGAAQAPVAMVTASAGLATGTSTAQPPLPAVTANAGLATGTGAALQPAAAVTVPAGLATGTGAALAPVPAVTAFAGLATGTGAALQPTVSTSGNTTANAGLATGTGAALSPSVTIAPNAGLATGTGAALQPSVTVTASAGLASGTGAALQPAIAITVPAGLATGTGAALQPTVSTSGNTTANAQLATGTGTAQPPVPLIAALAGLATGTGAALNGQRIIPASLATGTGAAQQPVLAVLAQASAAQALAAALNGTVPAQHVPAKSTASVTVADTSASSVTDPRDGTDAVTAVATSTSSVS